MAVPETTLNWLYSVLTSVSSACHPRRLYLPHSRTTQTSTVPITTLQKPSPTTRPWRCAPTSTVRNPTRNTALLFYSQRMTTDEPSIRKWIITPPAQPQRHAACHVSRHNLRLPGSSMAALRLPARASNCVRQAGQGHACAPRTACERRREGVPPVSGAMGKVLGRECSIYRAMRQHVQLSIYELR